MCVEDVKNSKRKCLMKREHTAYRCLHTSVCELFTQATNFSFSFPFPFSFSFPFPFSFSFFFFLFLFLFLFPFLFSFLFPFLFLFLFLFFFPFFFSSSSSSFLLLLLILFFFLLQFIALFVQLHQLMLHQICFDLYENATQDFLKKVKWC